MKYDDYKYNFKCYYIVDIVLNVFQNVIYKLVNMILHYYLPSSSHNVTNMVWRKLREPKKQSEVFKWENIAFVIFFLVFLLLSCKLSLLSREYHFCHGISFCHYFQ